MAKWHARTVYSTLDDNDVMNKRAIISRLSAKTPSKRNLYTSQCKQKWRKISFHAFLSRSCKKTKKAEILSVGHCRHFKLVKCPKMSRAVSNYSGNKCACGMETISYFVTYQTRWSCDKSYSQRHEELMLIRTGIAFRSPRMIMMLFLTVRSLT